MRVVWTNETKRELKTSTSDQEEVDKIINKVEHEITNLTNEFKKKIENVLAWQERVDEWREKKETLTEEMNEIFTKFREATTKKQEIFFEDQNEKYSFVSLQKKITKLERKWYRIISDKLWGKEEKSTIKRNVEWVLSMWWKDSILVFPSHLVSHPEAKRNRKSWESILFHELKDVHGHDSGFLGGARMLDMICCSEEGKIYTYPIGDDLVVTLQLRILIILSENAYEKNPVLDRFSKKICNNPWFSKSDYEEVKNLLRETWRLFYFALKAHSAMNANYSFWDGAVSWKFFEEGENYDEKLMIGTAKENKVGLCYFPLIEKKVSKNEAVILYKAKVGGLWENLKENKNKDIIITVLLLVIALLTAWLLTLLKKINRKAKKR